MLSSDTAPLEAIRQLLARVAALPADAPLPVCSVKLGSTVATNALLERSGVPTALIANQGLGDVFRIGTQQRPELFELDIRKPSPVHAVTVEVAGRVSVDGEILQPLDRDSARRALRGARDAGARSAAIALIHSYAHPEFEAEVAALAREVGFETVVVSHQVAREMGLLARGETAAVDAYLTPLLERHVGELRKALPGSRLRFMQSSGGLTEAARFRGPNALLSGPAGGVVAASRVAAAAGFERAIGFDMGGTSTDVSLIRDCGGASGLERAFESVVGGVRVKAPMLRIHTVAAGGGSLCRFDGMSLVVGPESAGSDPGPLCYARSSATEGGSVARLALTDVNLFLGRIQPDHFPFPLVLEPVAAALQEVERELAEADLSMTCEEIAAGFVEVANASMAQAIQEVSVARGVDPRDHVLVGFGGAGGQHVCAIARSLGIPTILLHPFAGLLSAYGIGIAEAVWDRQRDAGRVSLSDGNDALPEHIARDFDALELEGRAALVAEGLAPEAIRCERWLDLRYVGTDSALTIRDPRGEREAGARTADWRAAFDALHQLRFGYTRPERAIEIVTARVHASALSPGGEESLAGATAEPSEDASNRLPLTPLRHESVWFPGTGRTRTPLYERTSLAPGSQLDGPAIVLEETGTVLIDPGFRARVNPQGVLVLTDESAHRLAARDLSIPDPVRLEVFGNRFMSIAEQMGAVLRNTALSINIKERLDYSCAVFDGAGGLVANAPHIPVHLGAMSETVRAVLEDFPDLQPGDAVVTNDPFAGGSHLPDVTVVTPVFVAADAGSADARAGSREALPAGPASAAEARSNGAASRPDFFVASRGHHADLGGTTPGSMPPDSTTLEEEGVLIRAFKLVVGGRFQETRARAVLTGARFPARRPDDNLADFEAMVAANRAGAHLLAGFATEQGREAVLLTMAQLQRAAAAKVAREIGKLPDGEHRFADRMDDGTPICVNLVVSGDRMLIDFAGTGTAVAGNLNAPRAVVQAAVIYLLRALVKERIPLNGGCLAPVEIRIPPGSLLDPPSGSAVVGGNVETSQRVVDVLLGALGLAAASQGTMNNVAFGDESFGYYETIGGGAGAGPGFDGASGVHTHMTNTRITDPEVLEARFPVRLLEFRLRAGSGGVGRWRGGDGLLRRYEFTAPVTATVLSERREVAPFGLAGGGSGARGINRLHRRDGSRHDLPAKCSVALDAGDGLEIETPGGGGYGAPDT